MILNFSTNINGKPTRFPQKIWAGFLEAGLLPAYSEIIEHDRLRPHDIVCPLEDYERRNP